MLITFEEAKKRMPACLVGALDNPRTIADLRFAALHEIACYEEYQDGHLTATEIKAVRRFLRLLDEQQRCLFCGGTEGKPKWRPLLRRDCDHAFHKAACTKCGHPSAIHTKNADGSRHCRHSNCACAT